MNTRPRILLFQTLPIEINDKQFNEWDKLLSRYIQQGKKLRIRFQTIQLSKNKGGLALPCLKDYYISAQLRILFCWCVSDYKARWKEIEENISGTIPIQARIGNKRLITCLMETGNKWINLSLKTWLNVITRNNMLEEVKILKWCCYDLDFAPNEMDVNYKGWVSRGLSSYCTWFNQTTLKSFQILKRLRCLNNCDFLQISSGTPPPKEHYVKKSKGIRKQFVKSVYQCLQNRLYAKVISRLYGGLQEIKIVNTTYIKQKWDRETNSCLSEDTWIKYCEFQWRTSCSNSWTSFGWKCLIRYFITSAQHGYHIGSSSCWRLCCSQEANHYHLFWACPKINTFWHKVYSELVTIFGADITFNWHKLLFGLVHSAKVSVKNKYLEY